MCKIKILFIFSLFIIFSIVSVCFMFYPFNKIVINKITLVKIVRNVIKLENIKTLSLYCSCVCACRCRWLYCSCCRCYLAFNIFIFSCCSCACRFSFAFASSNLAFASSFLVRSVSCFSLSSSFVFWVWQVLRVLFLQLCFPSFLSFKTPS